MNGLRKLQAYDFQHQPVTEGGAYFSREDVLVLLQGIRANHMESRYPDVVTSIEEALGEDVYREKEIAAPEAPVGLQVKFITLDGLEKYERLSWLEKIVPQIQRPCIPKLVPVMDLDREIPDKEKVCGIRRYKYEGKTEGGVPIYREVE